MRNPNMKNRKREIRKQGNIWQYIEKSIQCDKVLRVLMEDEDRSALLNMVIGWEREEKKNEIKLLIAIYGPFSEQVITAQRKLKRV